MFCAKRRKCLLAPAKENILSNITKSIYYMAIISKKITLLICKEGN